VRTPLAPAAPAQEVRKTVTVVFSDLKGSTNLGEALDSEALREMLARYFDEMCAVLERHGGTIDKYIGDAVMAIFGLPRLHEGDALRAVRAAHEMKMALARVNRLVAILGDPGLGKSRLTEEFLRSVSPVAQVLPGRCLS
jgi:class 3 adenylate cyclase